MWGWFHNCNRRCKEENRSRLRSRRDKPEDKRKAKDYNYDLDCGIGEIRCGDDSFQDLGEKKALIMAQTRKWILTVVSDLSM